jgi:GT2 family glycosyltransferase
MQKVYKINEKNYTLPEDFCWEDYVEIYDDLRIAGINTERQAIYHYLIYGVNEQRKYKMDGTKEVEIKNTNSTQRKTTSEKFFDTKNLMYFSPEAPDFDRSSGGNRLFQILKILSIDLKYNTYFLCNNPLDKKYFNILNSMGIKCYTIDPEKNIYLNKHIQDFKSSKINFDYCVFSWFDIARQYFDIVKSYYPQIKTITDSVDVHWIREERGVKEGLFHKTEKQLIVSKEAEKNIYKKSDVVFAVTKNDAQEIQKELPDKNIKILSNIHEPQKNKNKLGKDIVFVGSYLHLPNQQAAIDCVEIYNKFISQYEFNKKNKPNLLIVGSHPNEQIKSLDNGKNIKVLGQVENLEPIYEQARVLLAPLRWGAGIKGKICEAAMHKVPIVTTKIGSEGLSLTNRKDVYLGESNDDFVECLFKIYGSKDSSLLEMSDKAQKKILSLTSKQAAISVLKHTLSFKKVIISIVTYNNFKTLTKCVESILNNTDYLTYEIVITNNFPNHNKKITDYVNKINKKHKINKVSCINNEKNEFFITPNNRVIEAHPDSDIVLVNDDIEIISKCWLSSLYSAAYSEGSIACAGGKTIFPNGLLAEAGAELYNDGFGRNIGRNDDPNKDVYNLRRYVGYVSGCLMYMRRDAIDEIGLLDQDLFPMYYEDSDWQYRAHIKGLKSIYDPSCLAIHSEGTTVRKSKFNKMKIVETNREKFINKYKDENIEQYN